MSRQRDLILKAVKDAQLTLRELRWDPIGIALEMCGPSGGWWLTTEEESFAAYNVEELLEQIKNWKEHGLSLNDEAVAGILEFRKQFIESSSDAIRWNSFSKVVQDHRTGTIHHDETNVERAKRGLPVPWTPDMEESKIGEVK